jgi:hypothetical protein
MDRKELRRLCHKANHPCGKSEDGDASNLKMSLKIVNNFYFNIII